MSADFVLILVGQILSLVTFAIAVSLTSVAVFKDGMKYKKRKDFLMKAVYSLQLGIAYWVFLGFIYVFCKLKSVLDGIIM